MPVSLSYDSAELANDYERLSAERQFRSGQVLLRELQLAPGEKVLDVGCGTGLLAEYAAGLVGPNGSAVGIDPLPLRIEIAQRKARANLSFQIADANDLSGFSAGHFDVVYMNAVFHWLPEKLGPLREVMRVLKRAGRLGILTGSRGARGRLHGIRARVLAREPYNRYPSALETQSHRVNADELEALLKQAGFEAKKLEVRFPQGIRSVQRPTFEAALRFVEASSFGNFLGHLPEPLRAAARDDFKRELEKAREEIRRELERGRPIEAIRRDQTRQQWLIAVAVKP